ncbi:MAG: signal recognition particle protein [Chloroflexi bacterium]|jgi:signal recognition particle subunit SRP54|nr:signal recognition particle protein [Chloroflexota bacterium]MBT7080017.1 signal recognition particle protein [Chloroflexota bacterium]MBT7289397.1 signal recognition particle protein [Chloroflexota bacterium]
MFEVLSGKLGNVFKWLGNKGRLSEKDVDQALREVKIALLEGDVNFKVVKDFVARVKERALAGAVMESLTPGQQVIKIVNEELTNILGGGQSQLLKASNPPTIIVMVGLQGAGKTTTSGKLALHLRKTGQRPLLVACDIYRPAADTQLKTLGEQLNVPVYSEMKKSVPDICKGALKYAKEMAASVIIVDTAGRLHIDEPLMKELKQVRKTLDPTEVLLVADAMTGQDAVHIAEEFDKKVGLTGLILTKVEGDARGGAALSMKSVTGVPIKFMGVSEKMDGLEVFYPDRLASRILGMGDMLTLIEKAEENFDKQKMEKFEKKIKKASFDLEDFLDQYQQIKKMGSMGQLMGMIPGMSKIKDAQLDEKQMARIEAIIYSMTPKERHNPDIIDGSRRKRIAAGSGTRTQDVNQLLNQFRQMQKMMKQMSKGRGILPKLGNLKNMLPF